VGPLVVGRPIPAAAAAAAAATTAASASGFHELVPAGCGPMTGIRWPWLEEEEEEDALLGRLREGASIEILPSFLSKSTSVRAILV
jgi:hypothetical protein